MPKSKAEFILELQQFDQPLSPYQIAQMIRLEYAWLAHYQGDDGLDPKHFRGYMLRPKLDPTRGYTPDNPALFTCVISTLQSVPWQHITWIKEMLQILDAPSHHTADSEQLGSLLDLRVAYTPNDESTQPHVAADKNGLTLALGSAVPLRYREVLRNTDFVEKHGKEKVAEMLNVPIELFDFLLDEEFDENFGKAIIEAQREGATRSLNPSA